MAISKEKIFAMTIMCHDSNMNLKSTRFVDVFFLKNFEMMYFLKKTYKQQLLICILIAKFKVC